MRRHVIGTLGTVNKQGGAIADQPVEGAFQVAPNVRVGVFLSLKAG